MTTRTRPRPEPCSKCGGAVVEVVITFDDVRVGLMGSGYAPVINFRHAARSGVSEPIDDACTREPLGA